MMGDDDISEGEYLAATDPNITGDMYDYSDYEYVTTSAADKQVLKNLATMGSHLKELKLRMIKAEAEFKQAEKEYNYYAGTVLPMEMFNAGVNSIELADGGRMTYERKYYCQPNKNDEDKRIMAEWLREHGGDHLVKEKAAVDARQIDKLKEAGIPFVEIDEINTNSLKAFLKSQIGASGGVAQIQVTDIPACMHFQEVGLVDIEC